MNDFTASNGIHIWEGARGSLAFHDGDETPLAETIDRSTADALREFFRAETDERLNRWRDPVQPELLVYPVPGDGSRVHVFDETTGVTYSASRFSAQGGNGSAAHYFDAHPEPKPWRDAAVGDAWVLDTGMGDIVFSVVQVSRGGESIFVFTRGTAFGRAEQLHVDDPGIQSGRRIWPEVSS